MFKDDDDALFEWQDSKAEGHFIETERMPKPKVLHRSGCPHFEGLTQFGGRISRTLARRGVAYDLPVGTRVRAGGCLCGAVRYSVRGDPVHVRRCHCADCRKESGSAFSVYAQWPVDAFEMSGEISSYDGRGFCARCGSRLLDTTGLGDALIEIRLGSLDEAPFELKPEDEIWVKRRESWILAVEGAAQHDESRR
jgi:hypothetical protein